MPLRRYEIRNEYSLADPELYRAPDKNDSEALLEGVAMAGLVGLLRQLGDLAEFAADLFHNLHEEVMATAGRSHGLMNRLQQVEADIPSIEKAFLSHTSDKKLLYNAGIDWHPNLRMDQNMITQGDLPRFVMDSYEECRGPPRLFLLDKFDIAGAGACSKRYSDPSFFRTDFTSYEKTQTASNKEKKARKIKRRASLCRNGEASEIVPTSTSKLHQLFLEENNQTENIMPIHHVKLKRRESNCSVLDPTTEKSYMQKFLDTSSPESKAVYENSVSPLLLTMESGNSRELVLEIHEIGTRSPDSKLEKIDGSPARSPSKQDNVLGQSVDELIPDYELKNNPSTLYKVGDQKEFFGRDSKTEPSTDGYLSDDVTSDIDNFVDALTIMESEMETDIVNRLKYERGLNIEEKREDFDTNEKQHKLQVQFSDTHSIGSSIADDDGNNPFIKKRFSLSYSNTISTSTENVPLDDVAAKLYPTPETFLAGTVHEYSENLFDDGDVLRLKSLDTVAPYGPCNHASEESLSKSQLVEPSFVEVSFGVEEDEKNLGNILPSEAEIFDLPFQSKDDLLPFDSLKSQTVELLDDRSPNKHVEVSLIENVFNVELDLPHSATLSTNKKFHDLEKQEQEAGSAIIPSQCLPDADTHDKVDGMKPGADGVGVVAEVRNVISSSGKKQEYLTSVKNHLESDNFTEDKTLKLMDEVPPTELGSASAGFSCSEVETSYNNVNGFSNTTACDVQDGPALDWVRFNSFSPKENSDIPLDFPSEYAVSDIRESSSVIEIHSQLADLASGTNCAKTDEEDSILDHNPIHSPNEDHINSGKCHVNGESGEDKVNITEITAQRQINGPDAKKEPVVGSSVFNDEVCDTQLDKPPTSKLLNNVNGPLLVEHSHDCSNLSDDFNYLSSLRESDRQLASNDHPQSHLSGSSEVTKSSSSHSPPELEAPLEQGLEIKADLLNVWSLHEDEDIEVSSNHRDFDDRDEPSVSSYEDPLCQPLEQKQSERSEVSEAIHEQPLDSAPSTAALDFSQPDHSALQANMEETTALSPLPPEQRREGTLQNGSKVSEGEGVQPSFNLFSQLSPTTTDPKDQHGFPTLGGKLTHPLSEPTTDDEKPQQGPKMFDGKLIQLCSDPLPSLPADKIEKIQQDTQTLEVKAALPLDPLLSIIVMEQENLQHDSLTSGIESLHPDLNPFQHSQYTSLTSKGVVLQQPSNSLAPPVKEDEKPQNVSSALKGQMVQPPDSFTQSTTTEDEKPSNSLAPPVKEDEKPQNVSSALKGQMVQPPDSFTQSTTTEDGKLEHGDINTNGGMTWQWHSSPVAPDVEDGKPNEVLTKRIPRPRNPLAEEFVSRDKIMLRKVEERVLPQRRPNVAGRDSLLEQIRTKSFNLKPAVASRPSYKGPNTNLKVVAILEKANAIRQALAGSDDDDDDDDSWSDS